MDQLGLAGISWDELFLIPIYFSTFLGFDKQTDVVALYTRGGHSPSCFWIGGFEVINNLDIYQSRNYLSIYLSKHFFLFFKK